MNILPNNKSIENKIIPNSNYFELTVKSGNNKKSINSYLEIILVNLTNFDEIHLIGIGKHI